jgi:RNA polymerase sigma-70 factor (ECF subfamily)
VEENESEWLAKAQNGDAEAFTHIVDTYQIQVYNLCYRMLNNDGDAEDAAQETFLRAYQSIRRYDKSRSFPTWLLSIAAHYCIDQIRKRRMSLVSTEDSAYPELMDSSPGPETSLSRKEERKAIQTILDTLQPVDRAVVVMYYWYEMPYEEIGQALDLTLSAVKSRLHRARKVLAEQWLARESKIRLSSRENHGEIRTPAI